MELGRAPEIGKWFSPSTICELLRELVDQHRPRGLRVYVGRDGAVYLRDLNKLNVDINDDPNAPWNPILLLIPVRLGMETINHVYLRNLLTSFRCPQSLGIIGGKPKQSLYFLASQGSNLIYLDPHIVQDTPSPTDPFPAASYQCKIVQKMPASDIDPSMALAFLCETRESLRELLDFFERYHKEHPLVSIEPGSRPDFEQSKSRSSEEEEDIGGGGSGSFEVI